MSSSVKPLSTAESAQSQTAGRYRAACVLPANLLNEGRYAVTVQVGRGLNQPLAIAEDCLSFHVHDTGEQRGLYAGTWPGVVRPHLNWKCEQVSQEADGANQEP
jgi:lipopolysaccharide transport system ATP-binding protein